MKELEQGKISEELQRKFQTLEGLKEEIKNLSEQVEILKSESK